MSTDADIIVFSETWLGESIANSEIFSSAFSIVRKDRDFNAVGRSKGGGVLTAVSVSVDSCAFGMENLKSLVPLIDVCVTKCSVSNFVFYIVSIYIPPDVACDDMDTLLSALSLNLLDKHIIVVGDFNAREYNTCNGGADRRCEIISNFASTLNLKQFNHVANSNNRVLDLVFTNIEGDVAVGHDAVPFVMEDPFHPALTINIMLDSKEKLPNFLSNRNLRYNFTSADYNGLSGYMSDIDWSFLELHTSVDTAVDAFYDVLYEALDRYVPKKRSSNRIYPPWFTSEIKTNLKLKNYYL